MGLLVGVVTFTIIITIALARSISTCHESSRYWPVSGGCAAHTNTFGIDNAKCDITTKICNCHLSSHGYDAGVSSDPSPSDHYKFGFASIQGMKGQSTSRYKGPDAIDSKVTSGAIQLAWGAYSKNITCNCYSNHTVIDGCHVTMKTCFTFKTLNYQQYPDFELKCETWITSHNNNYTANFVNEDINVAAKMALLEVKDHDPECFHQNMNSKNDLDYQTSSQNKNSRKKKLKWWVIVLIIVSILIVVSISCYTCRRTVYHDEEDNFGQEGELMIAR